MQPSAIPKPDRVLFLFVDGLGLREDAPDNPVHPSVCPTLFNAINAQGIPLDACLDVPGLPQSATGQAALFTGVNVPKAIGRHVCGFPGPQVRAFVERDNLFLALRRQGRRCKFANGYFASNAGDLVNRKLRSVTTVMALTSPDTISTQEDLLAGFAVSEDLTRDGIRGRGFKGPAIQPEDAACHLIELLERQDLALFEYFQTDRAGHSGNWETAARVLGLLDRFLSVLVERMSKETLLLLTSDHGNIETLSSRSHTTNPVPLVTLGCGGPEFRQGLRSITDITPRLTAWFSLSRGA